MVKASKVFELSYNGFLYLIPQITEINAAMHCDYNLVRMRHLSFATPPIVLPMPNPNPPLMHTHSEQREGVLFIGRHEPRKKADFIRPAKVAFHPALSGSYGFSAMETPAAGLPT